MTVPAHTRIDIHPEGDPYEDWVKDNINQKLNVSNLAKYNNLDEYFNSLANYSNKYFFSKDTLPSVDNLSRQEKIIKAIDGKTYECIKGYENQCLLLVKEDISGKKYYFDDPVHSDYYSLLAPKAISYGAGVIDLFFKEVKAEENKKLTVIDKLKNAISLINNKIVNGVGGLLGAYQTTVTNYSANLSAGLNSNSGAQTAEEQSNQSDQIGKVLSAIEEGIKAEDLFKPKPTEASDKAVKKDNLSGASPAAGKNTAVDESKKSTTLPAKPQDKDSANGGKALPLDNNQKDKVGEKNKTVAGQGQSFILVAGDSLAPDTEIVSFPNQISSSTSASFTFASNESGSSFQYNLDSSGWQDCGSHCNFTGLSDGQHVLEVRAIDQVGNIDLTPTQFSWLIDIAAPRVTISSGPANFASSSSATFNFIADESGCTFECNLDGVGWSGCPGQQSYFALANGAHNFKVRARDKAGNNSLTPAELNWTIKTAAPQITIISSPANFASSSDANFQFTSDEANVNYFCQLDNLDWQTCSASTTLSSLAEAEHNLKVKGNDQTGNVSAETNFSWLVDLTAATSTVDSLLAQYSQTGFTVSWSGGDASSTPTSGLASYDVQYKIGAGDWQEWINATTSASTIFNILVDSGQNVYFRSRAHDKAGNIEDWPIDLNGDAFTKVGISHIVISEAQIAGAIAADEFVELYNPTSQAINLSGYRLSKKTASGNPTNLLTSFADFNLPGHSYYLITHPANYDGETTADAVYSTGESITSSSTVILYSDAGHTVVDKIGLGSAIDFENQAVANPLANQSLERKAQSNSTTDLMMSGSDQWQGNSYDSDNNSNDFILRTSPQPQNSDWPTEPRADAPVMPTTITNLTVQNIYTTTNLIKLSWSSPNNANIGVGAYYDLRYQLKTGNCNLQINWKNASQVASLSLPVPSLLAGQEQTAEVSGLTANAEYCFGLKVYNGAAWSNLSNQINEKTKDISLNNITVDSISSAPSGFSPRIWTHTVSGNDVVLLVQVYWKPNNTNVSSVTYGGQNLTLATESTISASNLAIYYLANPPSGSNNIVVSFPTADHRFFASAVSLKNCDTGSPIDSTLARHAQSVYIQDHITVTSPNAMLVDALAIDVSDGELKADPDQTEFYNYYETEFMWYLFAGASYKAASGLGANSFGWTQTGNNTWTHTIVAIKPKP